MRTVRSKCELSQQYPIRFSRVGMQEISKIQWRGKHSHQYTFLMQHLLVYYEMWMYATSWFSDCTTAVYGEMYQLHKLLTADISPMWLVSGKSHPLATMWLIAFLATKCHKMIQTTGMKWRKLFVYIQITDKWKAGKSKYNAHGNGKTFFTSSIFFEKYSPHKRQNEGGIKHGTPAA